MTRQHAAAGAAAAVGGLSLLYLRAGPGLQVLVLHLAGWFSVAGMVVGLRIRRPDRRSGWWCLLAGQICLGIGDVLHLHHERVFGWAASRVMDNAGPLYLVAFVLIAAGLATMARSRGGRLGEGIDAAILASTYLLVLWVLLMRTIVDDASVPGRAKAIALAYPAASVVVLGMTAWLALAPGRRPRSPVWLVSGYLAWFTANVIYGGRALDGGRVQEAWMHLGFVIGYLAIGWAALAGRGHAISTQTRAAGPASRKRVLAIGTLALVWPATLAAASLRGTDLAVTQMALGCFVLFLLALLRMMGLIGSVERHAAALDKQRSALDLLVSQLRESDSQRRRVLDGVVTASESERAALAADLHNGPIQHITVVTLHLELALMSLADHAYSEVREELLNAQAVLRREVGALRNVMATLRPPALDAGGLLHAVRDHVGEFVRGTRVFCSVSGHLPHRLDPDVETVLYRVVQESLTNVDKHAGASTVDVGLVASDGLVTLTVRDDGIGFDTSTAPAGEASGRLGLAGMHQRVKMAGGVLTVESVQGLGTMVRAAIPASTKEEIPGEVTSCPAR